MFVYIKVWVPTQGVPDVNHKRYQQSRITKSSRNKKHIPHAWVGQIAFVAEIQGANFESNKLLLTVREWMIYDKSEIMS